jgi:hypothetical protein
MGDEKLVENNIREKLMEEIIGKHMHIPGFEDIFNLKNVNCIFAYSSLWA